MVFSVMMVIKGMSYALNNPTKEILYQVYLILNVLHSHHYNFKKNSMNNFEYLFLT